MNAAARVGLLLLAVPWGLLAVVVIGGLVTSTLLTLVLLPTLYVWLEQRVEQHKNRNGDKS